MGGADRTVTGVGYHDHNWGNAPMLDLMHHWYWARGAAGPYSVIASYITAEKRYGYRALPVFMLARDGELIADDSGSRPGAVGGEQLSGLGPELRGFLRKHITIPGLHWRQIGFEPTGDPGLAPFTESLDVLGDGSLVLVPTPGHTAGSMSLLIRRRERSPLLLVGDLTYGAELLLRGQVPGVGVRRQLVETTRKVLALKQTTPDLVILPAHDPTASSGCWRAEAGGNQ